MNPQRNTIDDAIRTKVIRSLKNYNETLRMIALLKYKLEHPPFLLPEEMIEIITFAKSTNIGCPSNHISDKTYDAVIGYLEKTDKANMEIYQSTAARLRPLQWEVEKLEYYLSLLESAQRDIITLHYFDKMTIEEIAEKLKVSRSTANKIKNDAVSELVGMYQFAADPT